MSFNAMRENKIPTKSFKFTESHAYNTIEHIEGGDVAYSDNNLMVILKSKLKIYVVM